MVYKWGEMFLEREKTEAKQVRSAGLLPNSANYGNILYKIQSNLIFVIKMYCSNYL